MPDTQLLDPAFLKRLERLRVRARRAFPGTTKGDRRSTRRGSSVEFADFREYAAGDDLRHLDWSVYARLERMMLRLYVEEEDVRIDLLVDASRSMNFGEPETKFDYARRVAAAIGYLGIASLDRVGAAHFAQALGPRVRAARGRGQLFTLLDYLAKLEIAPAGVETNLAAALDRYDRQTSRPGIVFVVSDFLDRSDAATALARLAHRKFDVNLIQVLGADEIDPPLGGDLLLVDSETSEPREVTIDAALAESYRRALAAHRETFAALARKHGMGFASVSTDTPFEELLLRNLRDRRLVG